MSTWKDVVTLSAEWRSEQYKEEFLEIFLNDIADLMLLITKN